MKHFWALIISIPFAIPLLCETPGQGHPPHEERSMHGMYGTYSMQRDATGTSWMPASTLMPGIHRNPDDWLVMVHGFLMAIYDHQGGPSGADKFFSENMFMWTAQKDFGMGTFALRNMISLEPATIGCHGYPLLLQTGETCNGITPLINRQHPHDFLMELAAVYTLRFSQENSLFAYLGYPGEPALGPPAYIHRFSAFFNPEAPITHHWMDSTHITFGVGTLGYVHKWLKIDASLFTGREPDPQRWNFDSPTFDSYCARISINPTENIAAQVSYGYLKSPEALEPNVNTHRSTASLSYNKAWAVSNWQTTAAWGLDLNRPGHALNGYLLESAMELYNKHVIFGRAEYVAKDDLFIEPSPDVGKVFHVGKLDLGYILEFPLIPYTLWGIGVVGSASFVPSSIRSAYGGTPLSYMAFLRIELIDKKK
ncbi:MAG: hypothetical protein JSS61_05280 [Verrucomicrobia bacterium]|nr:hypothetical protein [Verrucomicrobiota bacterium]